MNISGLTGIELDVQLSKDEVPVVIHDEKIDRTTNRIGFVKDLSFTDLKEIGNIPSLEEVLNLLAPKLKEGLLLNIELKTSVFPYQGIEEKVVELVDKFEVADSIIYSSFNSESTKKILKLRPNAKTAALGKTGLDCLNDANFNIHCNAVHPYIRSMNIDKFALDNLDLCVRVWTKDLFYPHGYLPIKHNLVKLESKGITGIFVNDPERYLEEKKNGIL